MKTPLGKKKILVVDPVDPGALKKARARLSVTVKIGLSKEDLLQIISRYNAIVCRTSTHIDADIIAAGSKLECIGVHATGWDHIDTEAAAENGIALLGFPKQKTFGKDIQHGSFLPAAEHVLLSMLAAAGNYYYMNASMKAGKWEKYAFTGTELYGKTLGIVGLGRIGSLVAARAQAFGMKVVAYAPTLSSKEARERGADKVTIETLCHSSDFISIHLPNTLETKKFISKHTMKKMKRGVIIVNTARASVLDEEALLKALNTGMVRMAALDVFEKPLSEVSKRLIAHPQVLATPHIAGVSQESLARVSNYILGSVCSFLEGKKVENLINPHILDKYESGNSRGRHRKQTPSSY